MKSPALAMPGRGSPMTTPSTLNKSLAQQSNRFLSQSMKWKEQYRVFPCRGKLPDYKTVYFEHGCAQATTDEETINKWAIWFPYDNVGLAFIYSSLLIGI